MLDSKKTAAKPSGLGSSALKGSFWLTVSSWMIRGANLLTTILLARLLSTEEYGLVALTLLIVSLLDIVGTLGLQSALIQQVEEPTKEQLNVAWTYDRFLLRFVAAIGLFTSAPFIASLLGEMRILNVIRVLSVVPFLQMFENNAMVILTRNLEYRRRFLLEASNGLTIFFSVVPLAFIWRNVWSVVVAYVAGQAIRTMFSYALYPHFPHLNFNQSVFKKLFPFGRWMLGLQVLTKFRNYMDQILLGPLLGAESLGVFQVGSRFSAQLLGEFYNTLKKVMFPIYSKMQYDQSHLKRSYKSIFHLLSMIIAPTCAFQVLVARQLALLIFGTKWEPIIPIMRIMAVAGAGRILIGSSHAFFRGLGKPNYEFAMYLFYLLVLIPLILFLGTLYRVIGVATAVLVAEYLQIPLWFLLLKRAVDLDPRELGLLVIFPLIGTILAASAIFLIVNVFGDQGPLLQLLFSGIGGGVVYLLILVGGWYHFRWESVSYLTSNVELILGERQQFERLLNRLKGPA